MAGPGATGVTTAIGVAAGRTGDARVSCEISSSSGVILTGTVSRPSRRAPDSIAGIRGRDYVLGWRWPG